MQGQGVKSGPRLYGDMGQRLNLCALSSAQAHGGKVGCRVLGGDLVMLSVAVMKHMTK